MEGHMYILPGRLTPEAAREITCASSDSALRDACICSNCSVWANTYGWLSLSVTITSPFMSWLTHASRVSTRLVWRIMSYHAALWSGKRCTPGETKDGGRLANGSVSIRPASRCTSRRSDREKGVVVRRVTYRTAAT